MKKVILLMLSLVLSLSLPLNVYSKGDNKDDIIEVQGINNTFKLSNHVL